MHEITKQHAKDLWVAGMADIFMYWRERESSKLSVKSLGEKEVEVTLACMTDPKLYEQPLTLQVTLPNGWDKAAVKVRGAKGNEIEMHTAEVDGKTVLRFDVPPIDTKVTVSAAP